MTTSNMIAYLVAALFCSFLTVLLLSVPDLNNKKLTLQQKAQGLLLNSGEKWKRLWPQDRKKSIYLIIMILVTFGMILYLGFRFQDVLPIFHIKHLIGLSILWAAAWVDWKYFIVPNLYVVVGVVLRVILFIFEYVYFGSDVLQILKEMGIAAGIMLLALLLLRFLSKGGIGFGDVKLILMICLYQGLVGTFQTVFAGMFVAFLVSIFLLISKKKKRNEVIPFGPFILIGAFISFITTGV